MPKIGVALLYLAILMPERLSFEGADLNAALAVDPLNLDPSLLPHVLVWISASLWVGWSLSRNGMRFPSFLRETPTSAYMLFVVVGLASTLYSVSPLYTFFHAGKLLLSVLLVACLAQTAASPVSLQRLFIRAFTIQWIVIALLYLVRPDAVGTVDPSVGYRLTGGLLFGDFGLSALIAGLGFLSKALSPVRLRGGVRVANVILYGLSFYFVVISRTRSTLAAAIIVLLIMTLLHPRANVRLTGLVAGWTGMGAALLFHLDRYVSDFVLRGQSLDALLGLTGRDLAFAYYIEIWRESPLLGFGFQAGSRFFGVDFMTSTGLGIASAHDALSKALVDVGILGLVALLTSVLLTWKKLFQLMKQSRDTWTYRIEIQQLVSLMSVITALSLVGGGFADISFLFVIVMLSSQKLAASIQRSLGSTRVTLPLNGERQSTHAIA